MATSLAFYGGVNEIGGNKILLEDNGTRVFLDFGMSFRIRNMYYDELLRARGFATIDEYVSFGQLPALRGLYRTDHLRHADTDHELLGKGDERAVDAVLITHGHMDHIGLIPYLRTDIQLVGTELTRRYIQYIEDSKDGLQREYAHWYPAFEYRPSTKTKTTRSEKTKQDRQYMVVGPKKAHTIAGLEFEAYPVDHSLHGACSYIIKSSSGNVAYTGDLRLHGPLESASRDYVKALEKSDVKVLLCEGTHVDKSTEITENELQGNLISKVQRNKGLVLANYAPFDVFRILTLAKAAAACDRKLLVNPSQAYYMSLIEGMPNILLPHRDEIGVLMPRTNWGIWGDKRFDMGLWQSDYDWRFKDSIFSRTDLLTAQEVSKSPEEYLVTCSFYELNLLHDLKPPKGSAYLWSRSMPYDEEGEMDMDRVSNWLTHFGIDKPIEVHCSGHMPGNDIRTLIDTVQPEVVVPIHTKQPELFRDWHEDVRILNYGDVLNV